jgi:neutral ceramidase
MKMRSILRGLVVAVFLIVPSICSAQMGSLRAGAAKVDISPTKDMFPFNSGQNFYDVHDPIYARALVLDNGASKVAFIAVENTTLANPDELVKAVTAELKIPADHLIMDATHDHNAPGGGGGRGGPNPKFTAYFELLKKDIVEAARQANANLQPARIGFGRGLAYVNTNRDEKLGVGYHMGYSPEGPSDKTVAVVEVTNAAGAPIAIYANYAVHGVVMFRVHSEDGQIQVTGDLPGWTSNYVEDHFKGTVALWTSGAAGDQNPLFQGDYNQDGPDVHDEGAGAWSLLDVQSRRLGEEVVRVAKNIQNTTDKVVLWGGATTVTCPGQVRAEAPTPGVGGGGYKAPDPATIKMKDADPVGIPLTLVMVNDIAFAGVAGEVFTEIGEHVKKDSLFDHTLMVTLLPNDIGYIPTDKGYLLPSEKAVGNKLKPGCAEPAIVGGFKQLETQYVPVWKAAN